MTYNNTFLLFPHLVMKSWLIRFILRTIYKFIKVRLQIFSRKSIIWYSAFNSSARRICGFFFYPIETIHSMFTKLSSDTFALWLYSGLHSIDATIQLPPPFVSSFLSLYSTKLLFGFHLVGSILTQSYYWLLYNSAFF